MSLDSEADGIPDECVSECGGESELDCNENGIPDACDIGDFDTLVQRLIGCNVAIRAAFFRFVKNLPCVFN